jgi:hypothetical protein
MNPLVGWFNNLFGRKLAKESKKRVCARCNHPIKRNEKWSAKKWEDGQPRHMYACTNPPPISSARLGTVNIVEAEEISGAAI